MSIELVMPSNHLILCRPLLLPPSIFPSIRVFSNENANVFAPTTNNIGYPQGRVIADANGNKTAVSSSEYAKYAHFYLPGADKNGVANCPKYVGDVVGILGFYSDNARYDPASDDWAISIRSLDDLQLKDANGNLWPRVEYQK